MERNDECSLGQFNRQLPFWLRHFSPEFLEIPLNGLIRGILSERHREPAVSGGKIMRRAESG